MCLSCGVRPPAGSDFCQRCGTSTASLAEMCVKCGARLTSGKSRLVAALLCALPAYFAAIGGIHRLYLGKIGTGMAMLGLSIIGWLSVLTSFALLSPPLILLGFAFFAAMWIWSLIDFVILLTGNMRDSNGNTVHRW